MFQKQDSGLGSTQEQELGKGWLHSEPERPQTHLALQGEWARKGRPWACRPLGCTSGVLSSECAVCQKRLPSLLSLSPGSREQRRGPCLQELPAHMVPLELGLPSLTSPHSRPPNCPMPVSPSISLGSLEVSTMSTLYSLCLRQPSLVTGGKEPSGPRLFQHATHLSFTKWIREKRIDQELSHKTFIPGDGQPVLQGLG